MDKDGLELVHRTIEGSGARIRNYDTILGNIMAKGYDVRYISVTAPTPPEIDEAQANLKAAGLMYQHYTDMTHDEQVGAGEGPLLYAYGFKTMRNIPERERRDDDEEIELEDLRSSSPHDDSPAYEGD